MALDIINPESPRIRLLTFNLFPKMSGSSDSPDVDQFAAEYVRFQNHYLQAPHPCSLGSNTPTAGIQTAIKPGASTVRGVLFDEDTDRRKAFGSPDWLHIVATENNAGTSLEQLPTSVQSELQDAKLAWLHVHLPEDDEAHRAFNAAIACIQQLATTNNDIIIVTALSSSPDVAKPTKFASLLPENGIRVPLWIRLPSQHGCAVQTITGSFDIIRTIQNAITEQGSDPPKKQNLNNDSQPTDLIEIAANPGTSVDRTLSISSENAQAVRTSDFLYVKRIADPGGISNEEEVALYAKPEDVWNINNVAGEYHTIVSELDERIRNTEPV